MTPKIGQMVIRKCNASASIACVCLIFLALTSTQVAGQASSEPRLSQVEQKIRDYVRAHENEQISFLEKAVNISSGTFNLAGVRQVGRLFAPEFAAIGFDITWIALPDAVGRAWHSTCLVCRPAAAEGSSPQAHDS